MNKTLLQLSKDYNDILEQIIESEGVLNESTEAALVINESNVSKKVDGYDFFIKKLKADQAFFDQKAKEYAQAKKTLQNLEKTLKSRIKDYLLDTNQSEVKGNEVRFKLSKTKPRLMIQDDIDPPKDFEKVSVDWDKEKVRESLDKGESVPGCHLEESYSLRSYTNTKG